MADVDEFAFSLDVPFNLEAWRIMAGGTVCESCKTPVALFAIHEEDDDGMPIPDRPTGEKRWTELVEPPGFGSWHTPERCRSVRSS